MKRYVTIFFCLVAVGCASTPDDEGVRPDWIDGQSGQYPPAMYLSGQGSALTSRDAKDRARGELAKQFEVAVRERAQQSQTFSSQQAGDEGTQSFEQKVTRSLLTSTSKSLRGVQIVDQWHDEANDRHYALAVLSRGRARLQFEQEISALDEQSRQYLLQAENRSLPLERAGLVQRAIDAQRQRIVLQSSLRVVDSSGRGQPPTLSLAELERSRDALLNAITLQPSASGDLGPDLYNLLSAACAGAGFRLAGSGPSDYRLQLQAQLDPVIEQDGWYWIRGTLQLNLVDAAGNDVGAERWELKASSTTVERTQQRLLSNTAELLNDELRPTLLGFAAGAD